MNPQTSSISLKTYLIRSWLILGSGALLSSLVVVLVLIYTEQGNRVSRLKDDLKRKASPIARRLSGELLVGASGNPGAVISDLREFHVVPEIELLPANLNCVENSSMSEECKKYTSGRIWVSEPLPSIDQPRFVILSAPIPHWTDTLDWRRFLLGSMSVLFITGIGIFLQWKFMKRRLLEPLSLLVKCGGNQKHSELWPTELETISNQLQNLLQERDGAVAQAHHLRAQSLLGNFIEGVLHDVQTPLVTANLILDQSLELPVARRDQLKSLVNRMRDIIKDHRKRLERRSTEPVAVSSESPRQDAIASVGGSVGTVLKEFESLAKKQEVELVGDIPRSTYSRFVPLSLSEISRILSNLIDNALYAAKMGKKKVFVSVALGSSHCEITVRDYGRGLSPSVLAQIEAGERATTTKHEGNGIGLLSARALVSKVQGEIKIHSSPEGTLIRIILPLVAAPKWYEDITKTQATKVIALDDDLTLKDRLIPLFPDRQVTVVQSEQEFLNQANTQPSALLLIDYHFGGERDGVQLILDEKLSSRAVLLSGRISYDDELQATAETWGIRLCPKECVA